MVEIIQEGVALRRIQRDEPETDQQHRKYHAGNPARWLFFQQDVDGPGADCDTMPYASCFDR